MQRHAVLKVTTVVVLILALIYAVVLGAFTPRAEYLKTITGSFLSMWALRSVLASGAPKVPIWLDYATLLFLPMVVIFIRAVGERRTRTRVLPEEDEWSAD
jgi:hypothetical protein